MDLFESITSFLTLANGFGMIILWIKYVQQAQRSIDTIHKMVSEIQKIQEVNSIDIEITKLMSDYKPRFTLIQSLFYRKK